MATNNEYVKLAAHVYNRSDLNRTPLNGGWQEIVRQEDDGWGFSAGAYRNGNELVISFAGTNDNMDWVSNVMAGGGLGGETVSETLLNESYSDAFFCIHH